MIHGRANLESANRVKGDRYQEYLMARLRG